MNAWSEKVLTLLCAGSITEGEAVLRQVLAEDPQCGEALSWLGQLLEMTGREEEALPVYQRLLELEPGSAWHWMALAEILPDGREAEAACWRALQLEEENEAAWSRLAELLERQGRQEEAALARSHAAELEAEMSFEYLPHHREAHLLRAVQNDPGSAPAWLKLARFLAWEWPGEESLADAVAAYRKAIQLGPAEREAPAELAELLALCSPDEEASGSEPE